MTKIAYNSCYGGFNLSRAAIIRARELSGNPVWGDCVLKGEKYDDGSIATMDYGHLYDIPRTDPILISVIEELGQDANGDFANLAIQELPTGTRYRIADYDGNETVMTPDDYKWEIA